jgi:NAD(P)-dependent dehydrogenase (short-subunit alcohol dehydrogenase family)
MASELLDRVALITGAASGIGLRMAEVFVEAGARLVLADKNPAIVEIATRLGGIAIVVDLTTPEGSERMVAETLAKAGRLDILVNNAGMDGEQAPTADSTDANWKAVIDINLNGVYWGMRYGLRPMIAQQSGVVINMASISGMVAFPNLPAYSASKAGVIHLTKAAAMEVATQRIRVNALAPSVVQTPLVEHFIATSADPAATKLWFENFNPLPGMVTVDAVAQAGLFLASDAASFITGVVLPIDGGYTAR